MDMSEAWRAVMEAPDQPIISDVLLALIREVRRLEARIEQLEKQSG